MRDAIIIAPRSTKATKLSFDTASRAYQELRSAGIDTTFIDGIKAVRPFVERALMRDQEGPRLVVYAGHGEPDFWVGEYYSQRFISTDLRPITLQNKDLLQDTIVYSLSCHSIKGLGRTAPAEAFIGFDREVKLDYGDLDLDGINDHIETFMAPIQALYEGKTVEEAVEYFKQVSREFMANDNCLNGCKYRMQNNIDGIGFYGDGEARW